MRCRSRVIRWERALIQRIRVFAALPPGDTDRALQPLMTDFPPLCVRTRTS